MRTEVYDAGGQLRERWDDVARSYTAWDEVGAVVEQRAYTAEENAAADEAATVDTRETNRATLYDRARTAIAANNDSLATAQTIQSAVTFNNTQRDDALRFLAGRVIALTRQSNALIRLAVSAVRADALDSTD